MKNYPEILILDEAFSNLDSEIRHEIKIILNSLKEHITIIIVDHFANPSLQDNVISLEQENFVQGSLNEKHIIPDFPSLVGKHCSSTAIRETTMYYKNPLSEAMTFGIGSGLFLVISVSQTTIQDY